MLLKELKILLAIVIAMGVCGFPTLKHEICYITF